MGWQVEKICYVEPKALKPERFGVRNGVDDSEIHILSHQADLFLQDSSNLLIWFFFNAVNHLEHSEMEQVKISQTNQLSVWAPEMH